MVTLAEKVPGRAWLMIVYAPFMQSVQITLEGSPLERVWVMAATLLSSRSSVPPVTLWRFWRVCVTQLTPPSARHMTFLVRR